MSYSSSGREKKQLRQPDAFVLKGLYILNWLKGWYRVWLPSVALLVLVVGIIFGIDAYQKRRLDRAWRDYLAAVSENDVQKKESLLKKVAQDWSKLRPGFLAAVDLADMAFKEVQDMLLKKQSRALDPSKLNSKALDAVEHYSRALTFSDLTSGERQLLFLNRAQAYELIERWEEAHQDFEKAAQFDAEGKGWALMGVARILAITGKIDDAIGKYEEVVSSFANSEFERLSKAHLRRLKNKDGILAQP